ncbi:MULTISPECIES: sigma factor [unclassified Streptomyces]|uniref:sigma factor n=1 Tax=unclassified Streptomyces TaxID=2593676 RepID=UPI0033AD6114
MTDTTPQQNAFSSHCATIVRILRQQDDRGAPSPAEERDLAAALSHVTASLPRMLSARVREAGRDPQDVSQEALERFITAASTGRVDPDGSPAGYLMTIAMNVVRDALRSGPDPIPLDSRAPAFDAEVNPVTKLLDELASADSVRRALALAHAEGDQMVLDVIAAWLDLAHRNGMEPTSRAVAQEVGISKTTVANALLRFRRYLGEQH